MKWREKKSPRFEIVFFSTTSTNFPFVLCGQTPSGSNYNTIRRNYPPLRLETRKLEKKGREFLLVKGKNEERKEEMEDEGRIRTRCYEKSAFVTKFRDHPISSRAHSCIFVGEGKLAGRRTLNELVVKCLCNFSQRPSTSSLSIERQGGAPFSSLPRDTLSTKSHGRESLMGRLLVLQPLYNNFSGQRGLESRCLTTD